MWVKLGLCRGDTKTTTENTGGCYVTLILHLQFTDAVLALSWSIVPWYLGVWRCWREKAQLLNYLVLLLVSLCQLLP